MGNQQSISNTVNDTVNKALTNVMMSSSQNCGQNTSAVQTMNFENLTFDKGCRGAFTDISQKAEQSPNFSCAMDAKNSQELLSQFKTQLDQNAQSKVSGIGGALNSQAISNSINKLENEISNNINISNVATCVQDNLSQQTMNFKNMQVSCPIYCGDLSQCKDLPPSLCDMSQCKVPFENISQNLVQKAVANCLSSNSNVQSAINTASSEIKQSTASENTGVNMLTSLISFLIPCLIICIIISISSSLGAVGGAGGAGGSGGPGGAGIPGLKYAMPMTPYP